MACCTPQQVSAGRGSQSAATLWAAIGALFKSVEPDDGCANYFRHVGYGST